MWLITPVGFFSVVRKPTDIKTGTLTVRARVRSDLEALKAQYLPELGAIHESAVNDYRFRAVAPKEAVAQAMTQLIGDLDYENLKDEVAKRQGHARAHLYHDVWSALYRLQKPESTRVEKPSPVKGSGRTKEISTAPHVHPQRDHMERPVIIHRPNKPTPLSAWSEPERIAAVVPGGRVPKILNGVAFQAWKQAPSSPDGWEALAQAFLIDEPAFTPPQGLHPAAGVVIQEADSRIWMVCPTNQFGGYEVTFPKGRQDGKGLQATAMTEAFEESGLQVRLVRHLVDVPRTETYTRYYLAKRVGGTPLAMGWESQCVMLVPPSEIAPLRLQAPDNAVVRALST